MTATIDCRRMTFGHRLGTKDGVTVRVRADVAHLWGVGYKLID